MFDETKVSAGFNDKDSLLKECFRNSKIQHLWLINFQDMIEYRLINELIKIVKKEDQVGLKNFVVKLKSLKLKKTAQFIESGLDDFLAYNNLPVLYKATSPDFSYLPNSS